jgi:hypothetical protein
MYWESLFPPPDPPPAATLCFAVPFMDFMLTLCLCCCFYTHYVSYVMSLDSLQYFLQTLTTIAPPRTDECLIDMYSEINDKVRVGKILTLRIAQYSASEVTWS